MIPNEMFEGKDFDEGVLQGLALLNPPKGLDGGANIFVGLPLKTAQMLADKPCEGHLVVELGKYAQGLLLPNGKPMPDISIHIFVATNAEQMQKYVDDHFGADDGMSDKIDVSEDGTPRWLPREGEMN